MRKKILLYITALFMMASCSTPKDMVYFQDLNPGSANNVTELKEIRLQPKDKISIIVSTPDSKLTSLFNLPVTSIRVGQENNLNSSYNGDVAGYTVDNEGNIEFPILGAINVAGLTREEVAKYIKLELTTKELVKDPVVTVEYLNASISVLGEVASPGRYAIQRDNITILDAISQAGDLTVNGKRDNVKVIRNENGRNVTYQINLCDGSNLFQSPVYYLQQNDLVYVEPTKKKLQESTVNGNTVRSYSFWISVASFLMTAALFIKNL